MMFQSGFGLGFITGLGVGALSRELLTWGASAARPAAKAAIGASYSLALRGKEGMHRLSESLEDLVAEARAEHETADKPEKSGKKGKAKSSGADTEMPAAAVN